MWSKQLPRTAAGKLDRSALVHLTGRELRAGDAATSAGGTGDDLAAITDVEATLLSIWREVLRVDEVDVDDDFFEIGGDSLLSIRVIARAAREGIRVAPERFFERPTVRHMAASAAAASVAAASAAAGTASHGAAATVRPGAASAEAAPAVAAVGDAPLTPIQHWFLNAIGEARDWWNQAHVLEVGQALDGATLTAITRVLTGRHDGLRLRLVDRDGVWLQQFPPPGDDVWCRVVALHGADPAGHAAQVADEGGREHASLRLTEGRLFRMVLFEGVDGWRRLLLLAHHLVVDGVSWGIVLDDLATLVTQSATGAALQLPPPAETPSPRAWALALTGHAGTQALADAASYWLTLPDDGGAMPVDSAPDGRRRVQDGRDIVTTHGDADAVSVVVESTVTKRLLQETPRRLHVSAQALLLAALLLAWRDWTATDVLCARRRGAWPRRARPGHGRVAHRRVVHHRLPDAARGSAFAGCDALGWRRRARGTPDARRAPHARSRARTGSAPCT